MFKKIATHKYFPFLLITFISLLYLTPLMRPGFFITHDGEDHIVRIGAAYKAFADGHIPPKWTGDLNFNFGAPIFIFFYPLPAYIGSFIYSLGINLTNSFKILLGLSFILAPITFYVWIKNLVTKPTAVIASFFYGFAPYHFLNLYVRADIGELFAFVFIPLVFLAIQKVRDSKRQYFFIGIISYALLILSHNILSLIFSPIFGLYILLTKKGFRQIVVTSSMLFFGLCLSAYFWIPALFERKYVNQALFEEFYSQHFISLFHLIYSRWGFGVDINKASGLSAQLGIVAALILITGLFKFRKLKNKIYIFWVSVFLVSVFLTTSYSQIIWIQVPLLSQIQFPWRFLAISSFAIATMTAYILNTTTRSIRIGVAISFLISNIIFLNTNSSVYIDDLYYFSFKGTTSYHGETTTIWTKGDAYQAPLSPIEIIGGKGQIKNIRRKAHIHTFNVYADSNVQLKDNTQYYPGWKVYVNKKEIPIEFQDMNHRGLITFRLPKGYHSVSVKFTETKDRVIGNILSAGTILFLFIIYFAKIDVYIKRKYA